MKKTIFFLQATARTGSTWLRTLLSSHPDIGCESEFLHPDVSHNLFAAFLASKIVREPHLVSPTYHQAILKEYICRQTDNSKLAYGFDLKLEQLYYNPGLIPAIYDHGHRFIVLYRINILKQIVSETLMKKRVKSNDTLIHDNKSSTLFTILLDPTTILTEMRHKRNLVAAFKRSIREAGVPYFDIAYEELTGKSVNHYLDSLIDFLGVGHSVLYSQLVKQNPYELCQMIENWDEIANVVRNSEFDYTLYLPT